MPFGSPGYAAPEQYGKVQTTPRADIYSLGVTLHQLVSGSDPTQTPFQFAPLAAFAEFSVIVPPVGTRGTMASFQVCDRLCRV